MDSTQAPGIAFQVVIIHGVLVNTLENANTNWLVKLGFSQATPAPKKKKKTLMLAAPNRKLYQNASQ